MFIYTFSVVSLSTINRHSPSYLVWFLLSNFCHGGIRNGNWQKLLQCSKKITAKTSPRMGCTPNGRPSYKYIIADITAICALSLQQSVSKQCSTSNFQLIQYNRWLQRQVFLAMVLTNLTKQKNKMRKETRISCRWQTVRCTASWQTCCKQIRWTLSVINY